ncbi:MAG: hypothetical protein GVY22_03305 [Gammaproteobacteria bacterium]|nr:hypothetical protein [Gammaproteobacteria bacterium]
MFSILVSALALSPSVAHPQSTPGKLPVFDIDTDGLGPHEIGAAIGRQWRAAFPRLEQKLDALLANRLETKMLTAKLGGEALPAFARIPEPYYRAELDGLAAVLDLVSRNRLGDGFLSWDELILVQQLPDFGAHDWGSGFGVYGTRTSDGYPFVARNLDRDPQQPETISSLESITVYSSRKGTLVNIGFAGNLGVTTGFNDHGLFVAFLPASGSPESTQDNVPTEPIGFLLRQALEKQTNLDAAAQFLRAKPASSDHSILMADTHRVEVLEHGTGRAAQLRDASSEHHPAMKWERPEQIAVVGCFALKRMPSLCTGLRDRHRWHRYLDLAQFDPDRHLAQIDDLARIMFDRMNSHDAINSDATHQVLIFQPHSTTLFLRSKVPTQRHPVEPMLYRYGNLANRSSPEQSGLFSLWTALGLSLAALIGIALIIRIIQRHSA